jgi:23S rRNA A1618 N6-methylase RlmF
VGGEATFIGHIEESHTTPKSMPWAFNSFIQRKQLSRNLPRIKKTGMIDNRTIDMAQGQKKPALLHKHTSAKISIRTAKQTL